MARRECCIHRSGHSTIRCAPPFAQPSADLLHAEEISRRHVRRAVALLMILLMVQIWLLTSTLESFLVGQRERAVPAALISGLLFLACMEIYLLVDRLDREAHK